MLKQRTRNSIALVGSAYTTFEAMFLEPDDIAQREEELEFLVSKMRIIGSGIKHICKDFVHEMFIAPLVETEDYQSYELLPQNIDEADQMLKDKEGIDDDDFAKEHCNSGVHSCFEQLKEVEVPSSSTSPRSIGDTRDDSTDDLSGLGLSQMKLGGSCIIVDGTKLVSETQEQGNLGPYEEISRRVCKCNTRRDKEKHGVRYKSLGSSGPCQQEDEGYESWDREFSDSEWETI